MRTRQAHRVRKAERIIRKAYGITRGCKKRQPLRFELIGEDVALALVRYRSAGDELVIRLARQMPDGRVVRMLSECHKGGFANLREQIKYYETLYQRYGGIT